MCIVADVIRKNEEFARGWVRLYPHGHEATEMAQYALDLVRMRIAHGERCEECRKGKI